jgi:3-phenylpropionate/trans-cinnamate dioxygenase ferredoxin reductase subunit
LDVPGSANERVLTLRHAEDAALLSARLRPGEMVVVVGGGFIGLEVAASARLRGCKVEVLEAGPRLLGRAVPSSLASLVQALHVSRGVAVRLLDVPMAFEAAADSIMVNLASGTVLAADTVVVGIGMTPEVSLAREAGLAVKRGIVVDSTLRTSSEDVYAAGDACEFPDTDGVGSVVMESWANAEAQAERVAGNMLGDAQPYQPASWMWSDQFDHSLQMLGRCANATSVVTRAIAEGQIEFHLDAEQRIVGAAGFAPTALLARAFTVARRLVDVRAQRAPSHLADPERTMKSLLAG